MQPYAVVQEPSRDSLFTNFGKQTLSDRYLLPGETYQGLFARVAGRYGADQGHAQRIYDYMSKHWFMAATPVLANGGTDRGLPVSCFVNEAADEMEGIEQTYSENFWLAAKGGGIGTCWSNIRSIGEKISTGKTSGVIPFIVVMDSMSMAISQGSLRRGSGAAYLSVSHPEVEEFCEMRRPTGGDPARKARALHHGVCITDDFMEAVKAGKDWAFKSPKTGETIRTVPARDLWIRLLTARIEQGEPYLLFTDTVNKAMPSFQKEAGLKVKTSNLCAEITLPTGLDQYNKERTAVCCLSSLNIEKWDEWKDEPGFIKDVLLFLDNVLQDFIDNAPDFMARATYSAMRERAVGLGAMGLHSFFQSKGLPFGSVMAKVWNKKIFQYIHDEAEKANVELAEERGSCPDAADKGVKARFACKTSIAPTASISVIAGTTSAGIDPISANEFTQKTMAGSFSVRNRHLQVLLEKHGENTDERWADIALHKGSVQHLPFLTDDEKEVFKTAFEIDQRWVVELAADRAPLIDQAQSVNLFLPGDVSKKEMHQLHFSAWEKGVKSLYYCRSLAVSRSGTHARDVSSDNVAPVTGEAEADKYEVCLSCQ